MKLLVSLLLFLLTLPAMAQSMHPESRLLDAINDIQALKLDIAEEKLKALVTEIPDFKLAQLVYGDVLSSKVMALLKPAMSLENNAEKNSLLSEINNRYQAVNAPSKKGKIPKVLARLDPFYQYAIVVDLSLSRLYLFENINQSPQLVDDFFVSMGRSGPGKNSEGDLKTPLGVYFIQSYLSPNQLADKYGAGAYPINYPNAWDKLNGRTGHGIWLHGTRSGTYNRPLLASEGCMVLPNDDLLSVGEHINLKNTPLLVGKNIQWISRSQRQLYGAEINRIQMAWKNDWQSLNVEKYLSHYSLRFNNGRKDFSHWSEHKRRVSKNKTFVEVELSNVSLLMHPNEDVMVATFLQFYKSDNFSSKTWKRQYWNREADGKWRIVFEGEISPPIDPRVVLSTGLNQSPGNEALNTNRVD